MLTSLTLSLALAAAPLTTTDPVDAPTEHIDSVLHPLAPERGWTSEGIVNGELAPERDHVLALVAHYEVFGFSFCSGTQISETAVITAAHCIDAAEEHLETGARLYAVRADEIGHVRTDEWFEIDVDSGLFVHPDWAPEENEAIIHDLAVVHTLDPIDTNSGPAVLNAEPVDPWIGRPLEFVGFGITGDDAQDGGTRRKTSIPIDTAWQRIVLSYDPETNTCYGDSGGAAFGATELGEALVGVNSFAFTRNDSAYCEGGGNGATRVDAYLEWILEVAPHAMTTLDLPLEEEEEADEEVPPADTPDDGHADCGEPSEPDAEPDEIPGVVAPHWACSHTGSVGWLWLMCVPAMWLRRR